jgi:hypothetical protein
MGIGDRADPAEKPKRGCLQRTAIAIIGLVLLGAVAQLIHPTPPSGSTGHSSTNPIPSFTFDPVTSAQTTAALQRMRKDEDKVEALTFYYHRSSPQSLSSTAFYPYIGKQGDNVWLRLAVRYSASDWLFFNKLIINADGVVFYLTPYKTDRHVGYGYVSEWIDVPVHVKEISILDFVQHAKTVTLRFDGPQFHYDKKITAREKEVIADVFAAYQALGGKAPQ